MSMQPPTATKGGKQLRGLVDPSGTVKQGDDNRVLFYNKILGKENHGCHPVSTLQPKGGIG
jgi:hypothetical protein